MSNNYYVYLHRRNDTNEVFYVGKGKNYRSNSKHGRNKWWQAIVAKCGFTVEFVEKELGESDALDLEVELIKFYRDCGHELCNITDGGEGVSGTKRTQEFKDMIGALHKGKPKTEDVKIKMAMQGVPVYCSNGIMFVSGRRAAEWLRRNGYPKARSGGIYRCCKGLANIGYGFLWSYEDIFKIVA